ncbi:MAG TPA: DUF6445 family protein [Sphingomonas sp.]|nr:DUF6445 family protein [Sphingomonas sp.]
MNEVSQAHHRYIGTTRAPLLVIDNYSGEARRIGAIAADMGPFPAAKGNFYPGLRRFITAADKPAVAYVRRTLQSLAARINRVFNVNGFDLLEASFSIVTASPETLMPVQRVPHFDSTDPNYLAILHYLSDTPNTGTAFYRQRTTGIEQVTDANLSVFVASAQKDSAELTGYVSASNAAYDQIARVEGVRDRLVVYQGCMLHSGMIPPGMTFSPDPRLGRLTANFFVRGRPR